MAPGGAHFNQNTMSGAWQGLRQSGNVGNVGLGLGLQGNRWGNQGAVSARGTFALTPGAQMLSSGRSYVPPPHARYVPPPRQHWRHTWASGMCGPRDFSQPTRWPGSDGYL